MKKLLATTALVMVAMSGAASAQSVLERVLGSINVDNTNMLPVTGTFANIAENIAVLAPTTQYVKVNAAGADTILSQAEYDALIASETVAKTIPVGTYKNTLTGAYISASEYAALTTAQAPTM